MPTNASPLWQAYRAGRLLNEIQWWLFMAAAGNPAAVGNLHRACEDFLAAAGSISKKSPTWFTGIAPTVKQMSKSKLSKSLSALGGPLWQLSNEFEQKRRELFQPAQIGTQNYFLINLGLCLDRTVRPLTTPRICFSDEAVVTTFPPYKWELQSDVLCSVWTTEHNPSIWQQLEKDLTWPFDARFARDYFSAVQLLIQRSGHACMLAAPQAKDWTSWARAIDSAINTQLNQLPDGPLRPDKFTIDGHTFRVTAQQYKFFECLWNAPRHTMVESQLKQIVWGGKTPTQEAVKKATERLQRLLIKSGCTTRLKHHNRSFTLK